MILSLSPKINVDTIRIDEPSASVGGQSVNSSPHAKRDKNRFIPRLRIRAARHSFITPTRSPKSGPEGTASLFLLSSLFLSSQNLVFSKLAAFNHLAMSVVRARGSCVAIRTLSPSTTTNRSCAHGSVSSGFIPFLHSDNATPSI